jgi:FMN-dependent NADH-azoreductase
MNVLHICANPRPVQESVSKQLAAAFFMRLAERNPDINVTNVDLYQSPPPFLTLPAFRCVWQPLVEPGYKPTTGEYNATAYSRQQVEQVKQADVLVLTMPMWNYSMPAIMKAWLDQVIIPGGVFAFEDGAAQPLHHLQKIVLLISSADDFKEEDPRDGLTRELRATFEFIGVTDMAIAWADGQHGHGAEEAAEHKGIAIETAQDIADEIAEMATPVES